MTTTTSNIVFDDIFTINAIDKDGKKFDRVSRLFAHSSNYDMDFSLALASSLVHTGEGIANGDAEEDKDTHIWRPDGKGRRGLEEEYDYVMYGRVYKFDGGTAEIVTAYISFGGLLMTLTGSYRHMTGIVLGDPVYLLMRQ
ncbi:RNA polymerase I [Pyrrhoderma noxium]|uniref:DNA-directed RNA polymerases I, II, and III subunit RPABC3 n=1 Tax=Pyrrhoderma noxium TaxID=2282107 RepID=A0A286URY0_9AGAM|nr:RNA polymerase I [Pyrrhoderma noxium]